MGATWVSILGGGGPDHFAEFLVDGDPRPLARALAMEGFERHERPGPMFSEFREDQAVPAFDFYVDRYHAPQMLDNLDGRASTNIWNYSTVLVGPGRIWIEHGSGFSDPGLLDAEMELIRALLAPGAPRLLSWAIEAGGQGYGNSALASGNDAASLAAVLA